MLGGTSRRPAATVAWTQSDARHPQVSARRRRSVGADTLAWRAALLAHLMATKTSRMELARRVGVRSDQVAVVDPTLTLPLVPTDTAEAATKAASGVAAPYVLTVHLPNNAVPLISIETAGPDRSGAQRLAEAAVAVLQSQASTTRSTRPRKRSRAAASALRGLPGRSRPVKLSPPVRCRLRPSSRRCSSSSSGAAAVLLLPSLELDPGVPASRPAS